MSYKVGLIGMIREELEKDPWGTLEKLAGYGYQGLESTGIYGETEAEWKESRKRLNDLGLEVVGIPHRHSQPEGIEKTIEKAKVLEANHILTYWGPTESEEQLKRDAEVLEKLAKQSMEAGLKYCYHNHDHEFSNLFGRNGDTYALEILLDNAPHLFLELDVAWCRFGGADPIQAIRRWGSRIPILHIKDLSELSVRGRFTSVGTGVVECFECMEAGGAQGVEWMVVEQDQPNQLTHFESAVASIFNIREAGLLHPRP